MLGINPEIVCSVIVRAREFQAKEGVVIPESSSEMSEDDMLQILANHTNDLTYLEVRTAIDDLEPDQQMILVALMYVGRGDYDKTEWANALELAREEWTPNTGAYLLSRPQVADFLQEGLSLFGHSCEI